MRKLLLTTIFLTVPLLSFAQGATTLTLPNVTFTGPPGTAITCTQTTASLVVPVPAGTVIFNCTVSPTNWSGAVQSTLNPPFGISGLTGNTFNVVLTAQVTVPGTVAPGVVGPTVP
jgi:hypothetical protein